MFRHTAVLALFSSLLFCCGSAEDPAPPGPGGPDVGRPDPSPRVGGALCNSTGLACGPESGCCGNSTCEKGVCEDLPPNNWTVAGVTIAGYFACASGTDGTARCWGNDDYGQLGIGATHAPKLSPAAVTSLSGVSQIAGGGFHACALAGNGAVRCWGENNVGQLGLGTTTASSCGSGDWAFCQLVPATVPSLTGVAALAAGTEHTCARLLDGHVTCWGRNERGELGDGSTTDRHSPTDVAGLSGVTSLAAGYGETCAVAGGVVSCWGGANAVVTPTPIAGITNAYGVAVGSVHKCAVLSDTTVACWGDNTMGQLGDGTLTSRDTPAPVVGLTGAVEVAVGGTASCALLEDTSVKCWGEQRTGQLGSADTSGVPCGAVAHDPPGAGAQSTCATTPLPVGFISDAMQISVGDGNACALLQTGVVECWGDGGQGQLGDGTTSVRATPARVRF